MLPEKREKEGGRESWGERERERVLHLLHLLPPLLLICGEVGPADNMAACLSATLPVLLSLCVCVPISMDHSEPGLPCGPGPSALKNTTPLFSTLWDKGSPAGRLLEKKTLVRGAQHLCAFKIYLKRHI